MRLILEKEPENAPDAIENLVAKTALSFMRKAVDDNLEHHIAQASFGCAWLWMIQMAQITPEQFKTMTDDLNKFYVECWERDRPIRERWEKHYAATE